ncbi:MAG: hypothetical protein JW788_02465 [Candidatus Omnitrophica bacterium]|nr:hypothetical protein [Candidatus Omnitrophota bacterium]
MKAKGKGKGITLIEVLIATVILVFASLSIIQFYIYSLRLSQSNKEEVLASDQLANMMEAIKCTPFNNLLTDFPDGVVDGLPANDYSAILGGYALNNEEITVSYVNASSNPLEVTAALSWQDFRGAIRTKYLVTKRVR